MDQVFCENRGDADYRYSVEADGSATITRCIAHGAEVSVPDRLGGCRVAALGAESFASMGGGGFSLEAFNGVLERVVLPRGVVSIGRAAFRGCSCLAEVMLPDTLAAIGDLAFSCTSINEIELPRTCVRLTPLSLRTGPESLAGAGEPYRSKVTRIGVDRGNPRFCMNGAALCRRLDKGGLEAMLCPGRCDELRLSRDVVSIAPSAFAGSYEFGILGFSESIAFAGGCGIATGATCKAVIIELASPFVASARLELAMPSSALQRRVFESTKNRGAFDLPAFLAAYDAAVIGESDRLLQAKLAVARLAHPLHLAADAQREFEEIVVSAIDAVCVQFGACGHWRGFDDLIDAGLLDAQSLTHAIDVLAQRGDATATSYLLEKKQVRYGKESWDYAL